MTLVDAAPQLLTPYYDNGGVTLYHADYRDVLALYAPDAFDHIITDVPYDEATHANAKRNGRHKHGNVHEVYKLVEFQSWTALEARAHFAVLAPYVKNWCISFMDYHHVLPLETEPPAGLKFIRFGIWDKLHAVPQISGDRPAHGWEAIAMFHRDRKGKMVWNGGGKTAAYRYPIARSANRTSSHRTAKPLDLIERLILDFTRPGDLIFDPCMGGGTTLVAAHKLGRRAIGCDIDQQWCDAAVASLAQSVMMQEVSA